MSREGMSVETAVTGLMIATPKLARLLVWAFFMVIHLFLLVVVLFLLRWFQLSPSQLQMWAASLLPYPPLPEYRTCIFRQT
jgi:hypothetical protein